MIPRSVHGNLKLGAESDSRVPTSPCAAALTLHASNSNHMAPRVVNVMIMLVVLCNDMLQNDVMSCPSSTIGGEVSWFGINYLRLSSLRGAFGL